MKNLSDEIKENKIIAIIRGVKPEDIAETAKALYDGGIRLMEVTFNQSSKNGEQDTYESIKAICENFQDVYVGAGTVMTEKQVEIAHKAGAKYIISPNINLKVINKSLEFNMISLPGAFSPTEIVNAYEAGAEFVKIFPAGDLGLSYIKAIRSPISHIPLLAVGGVNHNNIKDYLSTGIDGVGVGSCLVNTKLIEEGKFDELTKLALKFTEAI